MKSLVTAVAAAAASIVLLALAAAAFGHSPREILEILVEGSVASPFAIEGTLVKAAPLLLTGLAVVLAFRAGVWNIGGEGQFIAGALAAFGAARFGFVVALFASAVAGALWASVASAMRVWRNAPEVLTTILLNFAAFHLLGYCVNGPLQERSGMYPQSEAVPAAAELPSIAATSLHAGVIVAVGVALASWWLLYRTREGLRIRATGFNPFAARYAGISTTAQIVRAMAFSGAAAGLAGGIELLGVTHRLFERFAAGYGYSGIAVALLAQLHPIGTIAAAAFFGALATGSGELQRAAGISSSLATLGQAMVIIVLLAAAGAGTLFTRFGLRKRASGASDG